MDARYSGVWFLSEEGFNAIRIDVDTIRNDGDPQEAVKNFILLSQTGILIEETSATFQGDFFDSMSMNSKLGLIRVEQDPKDGHLILRPTKKDSVYTARIKDGRLHLTMKHNNVLIFQRKKLSFAKNELDLADVNIPNWLSKEQFSKASRIFTDTEQEWREQRSMLHAHLQSNGIEQETGIELSKVIETVLYNLIDQRMALLLEKIPVEHQEELVKFLSSASAQAIEECRKDPELQKKNQELKEQFSKEISTRVLSAVIANS